MQCDSSCANEVPQLRADPAPQLSAQADLLPPPAVATSVSLPPTLRSRVGKYALIVGGLCAAIGAVEGAVIGFILAPHKDAGTAIFALAFDHAIFLGLTGAGAGAIIGAVDWYVACRRNYRPSVSGR
jgi:hypothetical protein